MTMRVLLVEDEPLIAMMLEDFLEALDRQHAGTADSVAAALPMVEAGALDAAILDVNLVGEKVYPVADALLDRGVPFLFASGYDADESGLRFTGIRHLVKPLMMKSLVAALVAEMDAAPDDR